MTTEKEKTLREIIAWCEQEADKQTELYYKTYGDDKIRADAASDAFYAVAGHCWGIIGG